MTLKSTWFVLLLSLSLDALADRHPVTACGIDRFQFTLIPKKDVQEQVREFRPLADLLAEGLGVPVDILPASSYDSVMDAVTTGAADMGVMGPAAYILAVRREPGLIPFASLAMEGGSFTAEGSFYYSMLLVRADDDFHETQDLRGASVALGDPASTSGNLIPRALFPETSDNGFDAFFGTLTYTGGHDRALDALIAGRVDGAFVSSSRVDEYVRRGKVSVDELRVIWRSGPLHYDPFVFSARLCEPVRARVRELMMTPSPQLSRYLKNVGAKRVTEVTHQDYQIMEPLLAPR
ncbi:phosphate/phosphite/phosphonate ABC transporter substrate-binding protein [Marinobacter sp. M1N3S26]|uniref:phosphate/phosphite/phosphonate ABC transporter substrate-binding protein n=1 Tax=Marinobacter sp. M1N3S26 TaxID=3382299 RepID=UPI00387B6126